MGLGPIARRRACCTSAAPGRFSAAPRVVIRDFATAALHRRRWSTPSAPRFGSGSSTRGRTSTRVCGCCCCRWPCSACLIQTGAEELVFRGYLQQQLAARFASPLIWMVLPALIFGAVHYDPATAGPNVWLDGGCRRDLWPRRRRPDRAHRQPRRGLGVSLRQQRGRPADPVAAGHHVGPGAVHHALRPPTTWSCCPAWCWPILRCWR